MTGRERTASSAASLSETSCTLRPFSSLPSAYRLKILSTQPSAKRVVWPWVLLLSVRTGPAASRQRGDAEPAGGTRGERARAKTRQREVSE